MTAAKAKVYISLGLAALWAILLLWRLNADSTPQEVPLRFTARSTAAKGDVRQAPVGLTVLPLQAPVLASAAAPKRNIFAAGQMALAVESEPPRRHAKKPRPVPPPVEVVRVESPPPAGPTPEELAEQAARHQRELKLKQLKDQMGQYRYIGFVTQSGEQKAFLGKGHEIYILRQGDKLDGKFLIATVAATAVTIRETESSLETTIQLKKEGSGESS